MIPYFEQPALPLGPITIHAFGAIVASSVVLGERIMRRRVQAAGLDEKVSASIGGYALIVGFVFAHLFSLFFYFPDKVVRDPLSILRLWEDVSSFGGMLGGLLGGFIFLKIRRRSITHRARWGYLDAAGFTLPFAWAIGRIACSVAHDHPGRITTFPLAISLDDPRAVQYISGVYATAGERLPEISAGVGFHDLGFYEFLYLSLFVAPLFVVMNLSTECKPRPPGWWLGLFCVAYAPMRLAFDALRIADKRYFGFTPGQLMAVFMLAAGLRLLLSPPRDAAPEAVPISIA